MHEVQLTQIITIQFNPIHYHQMESNLIIRECGLKITVAVMNVKS